MENSSIAVVEGDNIVSFEADNSAFTESHCPYIQFHMKFQIRIEGYLDNIVCTMSFLTGTRIGIQCTRSEKFIKCDTLQFRTSLQS